MADLHGAIGLGVAGNFAGHLEQAGEEADFVGVAVADAKAPKGIFPFYIPGGGDHFLHTFPLSSDRLALSSEDENLQIEPEIGLLCHLEYESGRVVAIIPERFGAHNDCSIRRVGARKISEKKNWGACSKGIARDLLKLDHLAPGGILDHFRLTSYLERDGKLHPYGVDSAVRSYSYFHEHLLSWLVDRMNNQVDEGPLESISSWLERARYPQSALISIGSTRYSGFGETNFLRRGDRAIVATYDERSYNEADIRNIAADADAEGNAKLSLLSQLVE
jgi:hypothetical protein